MTESVRSILVAASVLTAACSANRVAPNDSSLEDPTQARTQSILSSIAGSRHGQQPVTLAAANGTVVAEGSLANGHPVGSWLLSNDGGLPVAHGSFQAGRLTGTWFLWSHEGTLATDRRLLDQDSG